MSDKKRGLNFISVAFMYIGAVIGAGFASGRELWQFFGIFGNFAWGALTICTSFFILIGFMISYIAQHLNTADMGEVIFPIENKKVSNLLGYVVAVFIYTAIMELSAAGGSLLAQKFGLDKSIGGAIVVIFAVITVLGAFERVSNVFRIVIPILCIADIILCIYILYKFPHTTPVPETAKVSPFAPVWYVSGVVYVCYNTIGSIPIMSNCALKSKNKFNSYFGAILGGVCLGGLATLLVSALQRNSEASEILDLPMLGFAEEGGKLAGIFFAIILFISVYTSATGTYYGFVSKLADNSYKKYKVVFFGVIAFFVGLLGYKELVRYVYPIGGYFGFFIMTMLTCNFIRILLKERRTKLNGNDVQEL